jgi:hypothetical protein
MALCDDLKQQRSTLQTNLDAVDAAIDATTSASQLQTLRVQQAQLRAQVSHVDALINQNCLAAAASSAGGFGFAGSAGPKPAAQPAAKPSAAFVKAQKEHRTALKALTATSIALTNEMLKSHSLAVAKVTKKASKKAP